MKTILYSISIALIFTACYELSLNGFTTTFLCFMCASGLAQLQAKTFDLKNK